MLFLHRLTTCERGITLEIPRPTTSTYTSATKYEHPLTTTTHAFTMQHPASTTEYPPATHTVFGADQPAMYVTTAGRCACGPFIAAVSSREVIGSNVFAFPIPYSRS